MLAQQRGCLDQITSEEGREETGRAPPLGCLAGEGVALAGGEEGVAPTRGVEGGAIAFRQGAAELDLSSRRAGRHAQLRLSVAPDSGCYSGPRSRLASSAWGRVPPPLLHLATAELDLSARRAGRHARLRLPYSAAPGSGCYRSSPRRRLASYVRGCALRPLPHLAAAEANAPEKRGRAFFHHLSPLEALLTLCMPLLLERFASTIVAGGEAKMDLPPLMPHLLDSV
jgi:hypothetical protein